MEIEWFYDQLVRLAIGRDNVLAHVKIVSAQGPNPSFFVFWGTFIQLGGLWGQRLGLGLGPGLDNIYINKPLYDAKAGARNWGH